jgi:hypothetical protein
MKVSDQFFPGLLVYARWYRNDARKSAFRSDVTTLPFLRMLQADLYTMGCEHTNQIESSQVESSLADEAATDALCLHCPELSDSTRPDLVVAEDKV